MRRPALVLLGFLMFFAVTTTKAQTPGAGSKPATGAPAPSGAPKPIHLPLFFEANQGQSDSRVQFLSRSKGYTLLLTPTETILAESKTQVSTRPGTFGTFQNPPVTTKTSRGSVIRMQLVGANQSPAMRGVDELRGKVNYLIGHDSSRWQTDVPLYSRVTTAQVYPGVDLSFHGDDRQLEYDFIVSPGADPSRIAFRIRGAARTEIDGRGDLVLHTADSDFVMHKPVIYQTIAAERRPVEGGFVRKGKDRVGFQLGPYDRTQPLVIDPKIGFATFIGGNGFEEVFALQVDDTDPSSPKIYIAGTTSDSTTFGGKNPLPFNTIPPGGFSPVAPVGFVAKIDPNANGLSSLIYLTFVGGTIPFQAGNGCVTLFEWLALDKSQGAGNVQPVVGAITTCKDYPFTVTLSPETAASGQAIASAPTRLNSSGSAIDQAALLGGDADVQVPFTSVNSSGDILVSGESNASSTSLPVVNPYLGTKNNGVAGLTDCYLARLERSDLKITYATYLNAGQGSTNSSNVGCGAFEDASGNILAGGNTNSGAVFNLGGGGANLANGFQTTFCPLGGTSCPGTTSATFAMKLNPSAPSGPGQLGYATYYSGGGDTLAHNGSFDLGNGVVAIVGATTSSTTGATSPPLITANAFQITNNAPSGGQNGYMFLINTNQTGLASLLCSTYIGGSGGTDAVDGVSYDAGDPTSFRIVLAGQTNSVDFPVKNQLQTFQGGTGAVDAFITVLKVPQPGQPAFPASLYLSTFIGSGTTSTVGGQAFDSERIEGLAVDSNHTIYASGDALSSNFFVPSGTSVTGFQASCTSCTQTPALTDGVIFSIGTGGNEPITSIAVSPSTATIAAGQTQQFKALAFFGDGTIGDITNTATWASSSTATATISNAAGSQGLATGVVSSANPVTITATSGTLSGQASLMVTGGAAATHFSVTTPGTATAGTAFSVTVTALDATNAVVTGYVGTVHFTSSDVQAVLPPNSTLTNGMGTFSVTLKTAGAQTITATDTVTATITGASGAITVTAATSITLQVKTAGTAFGTVTDNLGQINCTQGGGANPSGNCMTQYPSGTQVTLTATTPGTGAFVGAPTACTGTGNTCQFTITATETVTATFTPGPGTFPLTVVAGTPHTGGGTITSAPTGINCTLTGATTSGTCTQNFPAGTLVTLTSAPGPGSGFFGWSGTAPTCLASSSVSCLLNMSAATTAMVEFTSGGGTVNVTVTGAGNVTDTANAGEINCTNTAGGTQTGTCSGGYTLGAGVTLTETPAAGATFSGWTGASCTNPTAATCSFQVINTTPIAVAATFTAGGGAATHFSVTAPANATAGATFNLVVTALTAANTTATGYAGTVHFTSSDPKAVLPANSALANGTGTLQSVLNTAGAQTITATDTVTASITGVSGTITVSSVGPPPPMLGISKTHVGNFSQGQQGAQYTVTVSNAPGAGPTSGSQTSATVQSTGSIYATGGGSTPPTMITLPSGATSVAFNSVTGSITTGCASTEGCIILNHGTGDNPNDPDGVGAVPAISSNTGTTSISGMMAPGAGYLVGLFVPAGGPAGAAPAALDFTSSGLGTSFTSLSPQLDQVFFIGDGLTGNGTGTQQTFNIPTGAVQLWLGISDAGGYVGAPGAYGDNLGTYTVGLTVNAPGSGGVTVTETAPDGLTLLSMAGTGWTCGNPANVCSRSDVLAGGASYPAITVTVNVAENATSPQVNTAGVIGGGSAPANASDSTVIETAGATVQLTVLTAGTGTGTVTGNGINCVSGSANACMASLPAGTQVVLTQAVTNGSTFAGWNGAPTSCTVAGATCAFTMPASAETVTATFTAAAATLKSIAVTPANPTEPISSSVQFTATGTFSDNSTKDITATVTWASSNTEAATINTAGLATMGGTAGLTTSISATLNEVTGSTLLTVSNSPISISVTPPAGGAFPPVPPGGTLAIGIVLTSTPGFSGTVTFGCTTSSPTITCAPDPATVTLTPTGPTDVAIVLNTFCKGVTTTGSVPIPGGFGGGTALLLLSLTLGSVVWMWRRSPRWAVSFAVLVLMAIGGASCASPPKGPNGATQPGNYTVTFSATVNGVTTSTAPIPFTVQ